MCQQLRRLNPLSSISETFTATCNRSPDITRPEISRKELRPNLLLITVERWVFLRDECSIKVWCYPAVSALKCEKSTVNKLTGLDAAQRSGAGCNTINRRLMKKPATETVNSQVGIGLLRVQPYENRQRGK